MKAIKKRTHRTKPGRRPPKIKYKTEDRTDILAYTLIAVVIASLLYLFL